MDIKIDKTRENYFRRWSKRLGLLLQKSRAKLPNIDNQGGYRLIELNTNFIKAGEKFDLDLMQIEEILTEIEKNLPYYK